MFPPRVNQKSVQKYYIAAYLCKVTPVETLAAAIMKGKKIQKASVISESELSPNFFLPFATFSGAKCRPSYEKGSRPGRYRHFSSSVFEVSSDVHENICPMPLVELQSHPVLRCNVLSAAAGTGSAVDMPGVQQASSVLAAGR